MYDLTNYTQLLPKPRAANPARGATTSALAEMLVRLNLEIFYQAVGRQGNGFSSDRGSPVINEIVIMSNCKNQSKGVLERVRLS